MSLLPDITDKVAEVAVCGRSSQLSNVNALITWIRREVMEDRTEMALSSVEEVSATAAQGLQEMGIEALGSLTKPLMAVTSSLYVIKYQQALFAIQGDRATCDHFPNITPHAFTCHCDRSINYGLVFQSRPIYDCNGAIGALKELLDNNIGQIAISSAIAPVKDAITSGVASLSYLGSPLISGFNSFWSQDGMNEVGLEDVQEALQEGLDDSLDTAEAQAFRTFWKSCNADVKACVKALWLMARPNAVASGHNGYTIRRRGCERAQAVVALILREINLDLNISANPMHYPKTITTLASPFGPKTLATCLYDQCNRMI